jgi:transcriptional regulator GlxA family with amidase domain
METLTRLLADAELAMSVCTGAFVLARSGMLDDMEATTHYRSIERLREAAPKAIVHADRRFVDNGRVVTAAGVSAGIDGALHVVARLFGGEVARGVAQHMEYRWTPDVESAAHSPRRD